MALNTTQWSYPPLTRTKMRTFLSILLFYTITCALFLLPLLQGVTSEIPAGDGSYDGYQFLWNLWWMRMVFEGEGSLFYTDLLFAPHGTPLVLHSLSPGNGWLSLPIQYIVHVASGIFVHCLEQLINTALQKKSI